VLQKKSGFVEDPLQAVK